ncbi:hypothetical protein LHYA1_G007893 [Lachnellula hyalina]|uniref:Uncharacterized protein n=1 Tax=Lachnellula hyalina TaxID=1316788 RepID=A0A8H8TV30_9HELO|nr:uncharacterized protein LHYA1_G007893 [Lachnellula hyalina]TVY23454.1 hypothetical protein LHYA1_G007893 [Lachnellula hyalina]
MAFFRQYLTEDEEAQIHQQFQGDIWRRNNQVLWSGILRDEAQRWADEHEMQTLTTAMGPLMDVSHRLCSRNKKTINEWSQYVKGASAIFAWYISRGEKVTVLSPPPPERFHPSGATSYQAIEEPIIRGKLEARAVSRIEMVHPNVKGAENIHYQIWPVDETTTWTAKFGESNVQKRCWRMVKKVKTLAYNLGDTEIIKKVIKQYEVKHTPISAHREEGQDEEKKYSEEGERKGESKVDMKKRIEEEEKKKVAKMEKKMTTQEKKSKKEEEKWVAKMKVKMEKKEAKRVAKIEKKEAKRVAKMAKKEAQKEKKREEEEDKKMDREKMEETSNRLHQLEEDCREEGMESRARAKVEHEAAQVKKEKAKLQQEMEKLEKRVTLAMAGERQKLNQEFDKRMRQHDKSHEKRMQELEDTFAQRRDEIDRKAADFEAVRGRLSTAVKERDKRIETQSDELVELNERYDMLERAKNSIGKEILKRKTELALVKEFAFDPQPVDYS